MKRNKKVLCLVLVFMLGVTSLTGCSYLDSKIKDIKGELIGNSFDISIYDNFGNNTLNISGDKVQVDANVVKVKSVTLMEHGLLHTKCLLLPLIRLTEVIWSK